ncbi:MAG TPA: ATP-binding protein [Kofleriaceae bacterium]|nr:ATP-binding protein [Kofleriaceae bacterium]
MTEPAPASAPESASLPSLAAVPFKRRFVVPAVVLGLMEVLGIGYPLWVAFDLGELGEGTLLRTALPVGIGAAIAWWVAIAAWMMPLWAAVAARRRGDKVGKELAARAYRITLKAPVRALLLRTAVWTAAAALTGLFLHVYDEWPTERIASLAAIAALHAHVVSCVRAVWWANILGEVRERLFSVGSPLRRFDDSHFRRFMLVAMIVAGGVLGAQAAFAYYFVPITREQYLMLETYFPAATLVGITAWTVFARLMTKDLRGYLASSRGERTDAPPAAVIYKRAQALPYRLALLTIVVWLVIALVGALVARLALGFDVDDTIILSVSTIVLAVAGSIYEQLWYRDVLRPLLAHLTQRYRVPVRSMPPSLSLRSKLTLSFGGVVLLACGMALLWGFVQYKNLSTKSVVDKADINLTWLDSLVQTELGTATTAPSDATASASLRRILSNAPDAGDETRAAIVYYIDTAGHLLALGGGRMGAPRPPWYVRALIEQSSGNLINMHGAELTGKAGRLAVTWHDTRYDLGAVGVFYPSYRGRGEAMAGPLKELLVFFLVLFGACAGIVAYTVAQFTSPIRRLEERADAMARGELADPVAAGGEGDEIGRLTLALEEMRRKLRDKLRSTEEVNMDLERAVQMRTADLARKNRELAETLDQLKRAQQQLVRSEKLASIGQLVAGIAHEINNPVNAIVNTVGPLEDAVTTIGKDPEAEKDVHEMLRVVQRGAQRTKAIVSALHNYSRTDDESVVDFDVDRSIDDSLELLRHLLKQNVTVEKKYGDVGRVRGHAGQINQVFMNLLTNAAQALAGRAGALVTIETRGDDTGVEVKIADNGPGIPPDVLPRIWDPFFTTKDVGEGTGLGLSIVHELVERHGGSIDCATKVGEGTTFTVKLPRQMQVTEPARKRAPTDAKARTG